MRVPRLLLLLGLLLCVGAQLTDGQHWSHGWYPGGKRELDSFGPSEVGVSVRVRCGFLFPHIHDLTRHVFSDFRGDQAVRGRRMQLLETPEEEYSEKHHCK